MWVAIGSLFVLIGSVSFIWILRNPDEDNILYGSHDFSVKIGSLGMIIIGALLIVSSI
jgi:hypothetical protein